MSDKAEVIDWRKEFTAEPGHEPDVVVRLPNGELLSVRGSYRRLHNKYGAYYGTAIWNLTPIPKIPQYRPLTVDEILDRWHWPWRNTITGDVYSISSIGKDCFGNGGYVAFSRITGANATGLSIAWQCRNPATGLWEKAGVEVTP